MYNIDIDELNFIEFISKAIQIPNGQRLAKKLTARLGLTSVNDKKLITQWKSCITMFGDYK